MSKTPANTGWWVHWPGSRPSPNWLKCKCRQIQNRLDRRRPSKCFHPPTWPSSSNARTANWFVVSKRPRIGRKIGRPAKSPGEQFASRRRRSDGTPVGNRRTGLCPSIPGIRRNANRTDRIRIGSRRRYKPGSIGRGSNGIPIIQIQHIVARPSCPGIRRSINSPGNGCRSP